MRILHTSDWHLGRSFGPVSLLEHQQQFVDWLVEVVTDQRIDLVVVAGDIFDRAIAPTEAVVMFRDAVRRLLATGSKVVAITGNHDSADRVAAYDTLLDLSGLLLRGGYQNIGEVIPFDAPDGRLDLVLLPFLDPQGAPDDLVDGDAEPDAGAGDESGDPVDAALRRRMRRTHHSVLESAVSAVAPRLVAPRSLAVSHAFVAGGAISESERQLTVGGTATVDAALFDRFSYTALGHLHRPQIVNGSDVLRYSGTPLAYSFSEDHAKSVSIVDMAADGTCTVTDLPVGVGRAVCTITGTIDELLSASPSSAVRDSFVRAVITDAGVVLDAKRRLGEVYPHVVEIVPRPAVPEGVGETPVVIGRERSAVEVVDEFWQRSTGGPPTPGQRALLHEALAAVMAAADGGAA